MKFNRQCNYCGKTYYCCKSCISINSWKNVCCSSECYFKLTEEINKSKSEPQPKPVNSSLDDKVLMTATSVNGEKIDIVGYDLDLGKFDCLDGKTRVFKDFKTFEIPVEELQELRKFYNGLE